MTSQASSRFAQRTASLRVLATCAIAAFLVPIAPADAHHGFSGRYDRANPLYIEGEITQATYNQPHGLITIEPATPKMPPDDLLQLSPAAYSLLGGREVVTRARPIEAVGTGVLVLLLTPPMTTEVARRPAPPARGESVGAIVFKECSTGELRVQALRLSATVTLVRQGVLQREVDGCAPEPAVTTAAVPTPTAVAAAPSGQTVPVETKERADDMGALMLAGAAALAGLVALALGLLLARRGSHGA